MRAFRRGELTPSSTASALPTWSPLPHFSVGTAVAQTVLLAAAPAVAVAAALLGARASGRRARERGRLAR
jgi:hypothetical protein